MTKTIKFEKGDLWLNTYAPGYEWVMIVLGDECSYDGEFYYSKCYDLTNKEYITCVTEACWKLLSKG